MEAASLWVTILAGGVGTRFWPVSTPERPKQLLALGGERPLIVDTVERARTIAPDDRIRILAGRRLTDAFRSALPGLPEAGYWIEPRARGTWPEHVNVGKERVHDLLGPLQGRQLAEAVPEDRIRTDLQALE